MTSTVDVIFASRAGVAVAVAADHLPEADAARQLADRGDRRPALEHRLVGRSGHVVEVVVDPDRVVAELLGELGDLDRLGPLRRGPVDRRQLHLPALGHERPEHDAVSSWRGTLVARRIPRSARRRSVRSVRGADGRRAPSDLATVLDAIAARPTRRRVPRVHGDRRLTWADVAERTNRLANHLVARGLGCHTERAHLARPRVGPGPPRHLPPQRRRVPRVDARRVEGARRAVQRQLPLRRRRAALPARRRRGDGRSSSSRASPRRSPRCCPTCPRSA